VALRPQPVEADMSPIRADFRFDPERTIDGQFCCTAQLSFRSTMW